MMVHSFGGYQMWMAYLSMFNNTNPTFQNFPARSALGVQHQKILCCRSRKGFCHQEKRQRADEELPADGAPRVLVVTFRYHLEFAALWQHPMHEILKHKAETVAFVSFLGHLAAGVVEILRLRHCLELQGLEQQESQRDGFESSHADASQSHVRLQLVLRCGLHAISCLMPCFVTGVLVVAGRNEFRRKGILK